MKNRIILITGATSGVGKAVAIAMSHPENHVLLIARDKNKGEQLKNEITSKKPKASIHVLFADLSLQKEIRALAIQIQQDYNKIDVLINCAGVVSSKRMETEEGIENTLAVNYISPYLLSHLLLNELKRAPQGRIINVASLIPPMAKINCNDIHGKQHYNGVSAYLQSKVAAVMFTYNLAEQLKNTTVAVNAVHPGSVKTNLGVETAKGVLQLFVRFCTSFIAIAPEKSAERILYLANSLDLSTVTGHYFKNGKKPVRTNSFSYNPIHIKKLSEISQQLINQ